MSCSNRATPIASHHLVVYVKLCKFSFMAEVDVALPQATACGRSFFCSFTNYARLRSVNVCPSNRVRYNPPNRRSRRSGRPAGCPGHGTRRRARTSAIGVEMGSIRLTNVFENAIRVWRPRPVGLT